MTPKRLSSYSELYEGIVRKTVDEHKWQMEVADKKEAYHIRNTFYGYVKALAKEATDPQDPFVKSAHKVMVRILDDGKRLEFEDRDLSSHTEALKRGLGEKYLPDAYKDNTMDELIRLNKEKAEAEKK